MRVAVPAVVPFHPACLHSFFSGFCAPPFLLSKLSLIPPPILPLWIPPILHFAYIAWEHLSSLHMRPLVAPGVAWTPLLPASLFRFSPAAAAPMPDACPFSWAYPASVYSPSLIFLQTVSCKVLLKQYLLSMALLGFLEKTNWSLSCDPRSLGMFLLQLWSHSWTVMYIMSVHLPWTDWGFELCVVYHFGIPGFQLRELGNSIGIISLHSLLVASFMRDGMTRILSALQKLWLISQERR